MPRPITTRDGELQCKHYMGVFYNTDGEGAAIRSDYYTETHLRAKVNEPLSGTALHKWNSVLVPFEAVQQFSRVFM